MKKKKTKKLMTEQNLAEFIFAELEKIGFRQLHYVRGKYTDMEKFSYRLAEKIMDWI